MTAASSVPADRDRQAAAEALTAAIVQAESDRTLVWGGVEVVSLLLPAVDRLLADARADALRPLLALADEWENRADTAFAAAAIRRAAAAPATEGRDER